MIYLITGVPGSGKSLWAIKLIQDFLKEGRKVYADIDGLNIEGVHQAPDDWQQTPDGSVVVYDECQQRFGPDGRGRSARSDISNLEVHRHTGHDIVFITQRERLIHAHIRDLVGRHYHIQRQFGSHTVKIYRRDETIDSKSTSALNQCDQQVWRYDKKLFDCYKSATVHTHKRQLPNWLKISIASIFIGAIFTGFMLWNAMGFFTGANAADIIASQQPDQQQTTYDPLIVHVQKPNEHLMGCAVWSNGEQCQCYSVNGYTVDLSFNSCITAAHGSTLSFRPQNISTRNKD